MSGKSGNHMLARPTAVTEALSPRKTGSLAPMTIGLILIVCHNPFVASRSKRNIVHLSDISSDDTSHMMANIHKMELLEPHPSISSQGCSLITDLKGADIDNNRIAHVEMPSSIL